MTPRRVTGGERRRGLFRDAKVGEKAWSVAKGWGTIISIGEDTIIVNFEKLQARDHYYCYYKDGTGDYDTQPTLFLDEVKIIPPPKPKRKVKKVVEGWLRMFEGTGGNLILADKLSDYSAFPGCCIEMPGRHCKYLGEVFIRHEYEVDED